MWNRRTILVALCAGGLGFAGQAVAGPFDMPPREYGASINRSLDEAGLDLRLKVDGCQRGSKEECAFSAPTVAVLVEGLVRPPRIRKITISADLLRDEAGVNPGELVADAAAVLAGTMAVFDPGLTAERREQLLPALTQAVLARGESAGNGVHAYYALAFDQGADGLLVITVTPRP